MLMTAMTARLPETATELSTRFQVGDSRVRRSARLFT